VKVCRRSALPVEFAVELAVVVRPVFARRDSGRERERKN